LDGQASTSCWRDLSKPSGSWRGKGKPSGSCRGKSKPSWRGKR
jgi:hypothetical protein